MRDDGDPAMAIDPAAADFFDRCRDLARLVPARGGPPRTPLWTHDAAEFVLTAFIAFVAACEHRENRRNLLTVRGLLAAPEVYKAAIQGMQHKGCGDLIRRLGHQLTWLNECDLSPVMMTLLLQTAWMESAAARLASPDFELRRLRLESGPFPSGGER